MSRRSTPPLFSYIYWHYTNADENLFDLDKDALLTFKLLVQQAVRTWTGS